MPLSFFKETSGFLKKLTLRTGSQSTSGGFQIQPGFESKVVEFFPDLQTLHFEHGNDGGK
jgi:hypothetical protein